MRCTGKSVDPLVQEEVRHADDPLMTSMLITRGRTDGTIADEVPMARYLLHLSHDADAFVGEIQAPTSDLAGRGWLIERQLEGSGWAVAGPLECSGDGEWRVEVAPA